MKPRFNSLPLSLKILNADKYKDLFGILKFVRLDMLKRHHNVVLSIDKYDMAIEKSRKLLEKSFLDREITKEEAEQFIKDSYETYLGFKIRFRMLPAMGTWDNPVMILEEDTENLICNKKC